MNLLGLIFVVFIIGFGAMACWGIAANGASKGPAVDTFGQQPPAATVIQDNQSSNLAVSTMPVLGIVFLIAVFGTVAAVFLWLWKTGKGKSTKSGY